ncbi:TetR/AcrR family transcriptional regulator [Sinorhizobium garamanticum]|uniref:TetR/AcrR family transcriptional regulator n=1 Tax=Sinorhizobium garamanticum TaxID=680247 RepID=A0ABY8DA73_9HYPH|nr:TetR/AcrR family transcriptional regulator [Sinorhizobium garamanticum]WEX87784.1 TetR/AcrR family transcriptional regulator [Sinorhizobium garamanticum]
MAGMTDRRTARTQKALHGALMSLILRKGYEAVTVQDIIDEADVGRSTFYSHYAGKEDLLRSGFQALRMELAQTQHAAGATSDGSRGEPLGFSLAMFEHAGEYKHIYRALVGERGVVVAINEIRRILSEIVRKELSGMQKDAAVPREVHTQFVVGTFVTVLTWWLERRPKLAPPQVDAIFRRLVLNGIEPSPCATSHQE